MSTKRNIVIAGGGFAGAYCARALEKKLGADEADILLVNRTNYFAFSPLLIEAGTAALEPRHAVVPLRRFLRRTRLHMAEVEDIDVDARRVATRTVMGRAHEWSYDHLVLALGSVTATPDVPGLRDHGFRIKSMADAVALRDRAVTMLEMAEDARDEDERRALLTFVVVGGSYTGVEVAGEFNEYLSEATRLYAGLEPRDLRIVLIDHGDRILSTLEPDLSEYASRRLRRRGVEVRLGTTVTEVAADAAKLADGERIAARTVIWAAGVAPPPLLDRLALPRDERGYLRCEPDLRVEGRDEIWGVGDCAANPDPEGAPYPATAQHAVREGEETAANIARVLRGREPRPLVYRSRGMMAPLGRHQGVARVMGLRLSGLPAWFLWRTFYLFRMPGFGRSLRVMMDWTLDWFFRRDIVQLQIHGTHRPSPGDGDGQPGAEEEAASPARDTGVVR